MDERNEDLDFDVVVQTGDVELQGTLGLPDAARGIVLFAHGSGSSSRSPRNRRVARVLHEAGLATLLFDLLTPDEARIDAWTRELRFDIGLLAERMKGATDWVASRPPLDRFAIGHFGASTGAAAALIAAADRQALVHAVVSRGGRPDLAGDALPRVRAPTLAIVGSRDFEVLELNEVALAQMTCTKQLITVQGATHLFEEPGTLDRVAELAASWFRRYLQPKTEAHVSPEVP